MTARTGWIVLLSCCISACNKDDGCPMEAEITPGCGVLVGGEPLRIGDTVDTVTEAHGEPTWLELGAAGTRFDYPSDGVTGFASADEVVTSVQVGSAFAGNTPDELSVGSTLTQVQAAHGAATTDPYTGAQHYPELGISFEISDEAVERVHVFAPQKDW